jgi:hypothetical protein
MDERFERAKILLGDEAVLGIAHTKVTDIGHISHTVGDPRPGISGREGDINPDLCFL